MCAESFRPRTAVDRRSADGFRRGTDAAADCRARRCWRRSCWPPFSRLQPGRHRRRSRSTCSGEAWAPAMATSPFRRGWPPTPRATRMCPTRETTGSRSSTPRARSSPSGEPPFLGSPVAGTGDGEFNLPAGVATDSSNNVYVADTTNNRIQKFNSSGTSKPSGEARAPATASSPFRRASPRIPRTTSTSPTPATTGSRSSTSSGAYITAVGKRGHRERPVHLSVRGRRRLLGQRLRRRRGQQPDPEVLLLGHLHHQVGKRGHREWPVRRNYHTGCGHGLP